jgi:DNA-binding SARP family transcriptional activator
VNDCTGYIYFERNDLTAALEYCQSALDEEPSLEEAHRLAMRIHGARGNRAGVIRQYEQCKLILKKEINASPSPETVSLYEVLNS